MADFAEDRACVCAAPEVLQRPQYNAKQADVWSSGVMLYSMLFCAYPFKHHEHEDDRLEGAPHHARFALRGTSPRLWY